MSTITNFSEREIMTINLEKSMAILSVIAAHVVPVTKTDLLTNIASSAWNMFGHVGVVLFFVIGGFLYSRKDGDCNTFWKKKTFRIFIPWVFCSLLTYVLTAIDSRSFSVFAYFKWFLGSGTWYYYATVYTLFLLIFKWLHKNDVILYCLIGIQSVALILKSVGFSTTIPLSFFTDYLNPLHWIGYFSIGIILRRYRFDILLRKKTATLILSTIVLLVSSWILYKYDVYTYFDAITSIFCISATVLIMYTAYWFAQFKVAKPISKIGEYTFCIYLLHMQIVQRATSIIPNGALKVIFSPFIGLAIMLVLIGVGLWLCKKVSFGSKIRLLVGL